MTQTKRDPLHSRVGGGQSEGKKITGPSVGTLDTTLSGQTIKMSSGTTILGRESLGVSHSHPTYCRWHGLFSSCYWFFVTLVPVNLR